MANRWSGTLSFLLVLVPCWALAFAYHEQATSTASERRQEEFRALSETRHARLLVRLQERQNLLASVRALFSASEKVDAETFRRFLRDAVPERADVAVAFVGPNGEEQMAWTGAGRAVSSPGQHFDLLEPSRIYGEPPRILLSSFVTTRSGAQSGHVCISFDLLHLFLPDPVAGVEEYLVVSDVSQNIASAYQHVGETVERVATPNLGSSAATEVFEVRRLGDVRFVYLTQQGRSFESTALLLLVALLALGFLAALYVAALVTRSSRIAAEVRRRTDELSQFAYRTSHDLRAPLVTIGGLCRAATEDLDEGEADLVRETLRRIESQVDRLSDLVTGILDLARADLGEEAPESVDVPLLLTELCESVRDQAQPLGVEVRCRAEVVTPLLLPRARLQQILGNLVSNGVKYHDATREQPFVAVSASLDEQLEIVVQDNGRGIPAGAQERLFTMFQRFHSDAPVGSGLGLAIVKRHVDALDGTIDIASDAGGTIVTVRLPANTLSAP